MTQRPKVAHPAATHRGRRSAEAFRAAASELFRDRGFLNTTVADIAKTAGRAPASFYYHFDSREHVLLELFEEFSRAVTSRAREVHEPTATPRDQIEQLTSNYLAMYREWLPVLTAVFQQSMVDPAFHERWREIRVASVRSMRAWVVNAQDAGHALDVDADLSASALAAMLDGFCFTWLARGGDLPGITLDLDAARRTLASLCYSSLYGASLSRSHSG